MEVCPTGAMGKNELGLVSVDEHRCIGCGYCALSCPYHAPKVDRTVGHSVKCDGCSQRAVSYTHLDVYKRQALQQAAVGVPTDNCVGGLGGDDISEAQVHGMYRMLSLIHI